MKFEKKEHESCLENILQFTSHVSTSILTLEIVMIVWIPSVMNRISYNQFSNDLQCLILQGQTEVPVEGSKLNAREIKLL